MERPIVNPAEEVMDSLLTGIEEHKTGNRELKSLVDKLRRLDENEDNRRDEGR